MMNPFTLHDGPRFAIRFYPRSYVVTWTCKDTQVLQLYSGEQATAMLNGMQAVCEKLPGPDNALGDIWNKTYG